MQLLSSYNVLFQTFYVWKGVRAWINHGKIKVKKSGCNNTRTLFSWNIFLRKTDYVRGSAHERRDVPGFAAVEAVACYLFNTPGLSDKWHTTGSYFEDSEIFSVFATSFPTDPSIDALPWTAHFWWINEYKTTNNTCDYDKHLGNFKKSSTCVLSDSQTSNKPVVVVWYVSKCFCQHPPLTATQSLTATVDAFCQFMQQEPAPQC